MLLGEFEGAWQESDRCGSSFRGTLPIQGGRVLIRCLRGLGDAIQFLRYARPLRDHCDRLTVHVPPRLLPLCSIVAGIDEAISLNEPLESTVFDYELECSDLPYLFRTTALTIPDAQGYLTVPPERAAAGSRIVSGDGRRVNVGIAWAAADWNPERSLPLALLAPLTELAGVRLFSLQRGSEAGQLDAVFRENDNCIVNAESESGDILDSMSVIQNLDLVISVDTMVAHLAGAMGKPVWTLLTFAADWRWMLDRNDSPWYTSMRLFRQNQPGDWRSVVSRVTTMLVS